MTPRPLKPWVAAFVVWAASGCVVAPPPAVGYTHAGGDGDAVWFVEARGGESRRQYLVMCNSRRTPACARVRPQTMRDADALRAWAATEHTAAAQPRIEVREGEPASEPATAASSTTASTAEHGLLRFNAIPWCTVSIDGTAIGDTPIIDHALSPGAHLVTCDASRIGQSRTVSITIRAGETTRANVRLEGVEPAGDGAADDRP